METNKNWSAREIVGVVGTFLGSASVAYTVDNLIKSNTTPAAGRFGAIALKLGGAILSGMISAKSEEYISDSINNAFDVGEEFMSFGALVSRKEDI